MNRKKRTEILIRGSTDLATKLAQDIRSRYKIKTIDQPKEGLVMIKGRETAKRNLFYLGEVLVTDCKVLIEDQLGIGIIKGHNPEMAFNLAVIDAAYNAGLNETEGWTEILQAELEIIVKRQSENAARVLKTKVNFEVMNDQ